MSYFLFMKIVIFAVFPIENSHLFDHCHYIEGLRGSMSKVLGLPSNSYKPITNTAWGRAPLCKLQKRCTRLATASYKVYQLLAHGRWFFLGTPASSITKTGRHDVAEILLKVAFSTINQSINHYIDIIRVSLLCKRYVALWETGHIHAIHYSFSHFCISLS